ncbi:universal stress protein [Natronoarchaeum sp. GCM10025703]|uniref:universal stress protein n=1 Tax=unclassified Natronoarchaeum TaxID=2620183 RepID=UPI0036231857
MDKDTFERVLVPIASEADAESTCKALQEYLPENGAVVHIVHVIEKAGGAPDKAGVSQREERAERIFEHSQSVLGETTTSLETEILYGTSIAETVLDHARSIDASAIVFTPRGASRWVKLLTGSVAEKILVGTDRPVIVLPQED